MIHEALRLDRPLVSFDTETTGTDVDYDRIVEIAAVRVSPEGEVRTFVERINPGRPIPPGATKVHGIADADVADRPRFAELAGVFLDFVVGCDLTGFNIFGFDIPIIEAELRRAQLGPFPDPRARVIDTMAIFHDRNPRTLAGALKRYTGADHDDAHEALADAQAALDVLGAQVMQHDDLPRSVEDLARVAMGQRVDRAGKFVLADDGATVLFAFGKHNGEPALDHPGFLSWMLGKSFPRETIEVARSLLGSGR